LAIDIGTTHIRAGVVDQSGTLLSYDSRDQTLITGNDGKAEHDPGDLFRIVCEVSRRAAAEFRTRITTVSLSAYQLGVVALDRNNSPLTGVITLLDTRAKETHPLLCEQVDVRSLYETTGCPPLYHYPLAKVDWLRRTQPQVFDRARLFLSVKDYVILRLLGKPVTEPSTAGATQMLDVRTLTWAPLPLEAVGLDTTNLPEVVPSDTVLGRIPDGACELLGVKSGTTLVPGVYDGASVALGLGVFGSDSVVNFGTTAMLRAASETPTVDRSPSMALQTYYLAQDVWLPGAAINNAGFVLSWLRDNFLGGTYGDLCDEAGSLSSTGGLVMLPFLSGERNPSLGGSASGVFWGLRAHHRRGHIVRAALQGVVYALCLVRESMQRNNIAVGSVRVGGGAARSPLWVSMLATAFDTQLQLTDTAEPGLVGAGMIGHTAAGAFSNLREATLSMSKPNRHCDPDPKLADELSTGYEVFKDLMCQMGKKSELPAGSV